MTRQRQHKKKTKTRQPKTRQDDVFEVISGFAHAVDSVVERFTGKNIATLLGECQQRPRELPGGERVPSSGSDMTLADAYAVMGLPPTASLGEVERNYRSLARIFHPDRGGYSEAMVLLNQAYDLITRGRKKQ